jgi:hypothetical protein
VYAELLVPCWDPDPSARPAFDILAHSAQALGGVMSDHRSAYSDDVDANVLTTSNTARGRDKLADTEHYPPDFWASPDGRRLLGVSVYHIADELFPAAMVATNASSASTIDAPEQKVRVKDAVKNVVMPKCRQLMCPRDGQVGCAYVDALEGTERVGPASALLSYSWSYTLRHVCEALSEWSATHGRDPARVYVWMCALCLNQVRMVKVMTPDWLANEFGPRVIAIGRMLPLLAP